MIDFHIKALSVEALDKSLSLEPENKKGQNYFSYKGFQKTKYD